MARSGKAQRNEIKDEVLYRNFLAGDEEGLHLLMERYGSKLTYYIGGYTRDFQDAEDLMIEAFAYLVDKRPTIKEDCLRAYLYKMCRHLALRFVQKKRRLQVFSFEELTEEPEYDAWNESVGRGNEKDEILHQCMGKLPKDYREALYLIYFEDLSYKEAAAVMKKNEKQISNLLQRGKASLKKLLGNEGIDHV